MSEITVQSDYVINKDTIALIPAKHMDYSTIVWETTQTLYIRKRPLEIIKLACLEGGAEYNGRRKAVIHQTGVQHKVPIPINPSEHIYAFPTHSAENYDCHWIFYYHVRSILNNPKVSGGSIITFKDHTEPLLVNVSHNSLNKQLQRTSVCVVRFSHFTMNHAPSGATIFWDGGINS